MTQVEVPPGSDGPKLSSPADEETALFNSTLLGVLACSGVKIKTRIIGDHIDFELPFKNFSKVRFKLH